MPSLVSLTDTPLHTHVDSDPGSEDENDDSEADPDAGEEEDDEEVKPSPSKRRKCLSDIGKGKDTPMQKVHFLGQSITPPSGVDSMRVREVKGDPEPHFMEIMGSIACDRNFRERLPVPKAPTFPDGTDPEDETKGVFYDTVLRQKMVDTDPSLAEDYDEMQRMALSMRKDLRSLVAFLKSSFTFCLRIEKKVEEEEEEDKEVPIQSLTVMQKLLLGQIYLRTISVCKGGEQSSEEEEEEEEARARESSSEEEEEESSSEEEEELGLEAMKSMRRRTARRCRRRRRRRRQLVKRERGVLRLLTLFCWRLHVTGGEGGGDLKEEERERESRGCALTLCSIATHSRSQTGVLAMAAIHPGRNPSRSQTRVMPAIVDSDHVSFSAKDVELKVGDLLPRLGSLPPEYGLALHVPPVLPEFVVHTLRQGQLREEHTRVEPVPATRLVATL